MDFFGKPLGAVLPEKDCEWGIPEYLTLVSHFCLLLVALVFPVVWMAQVKIWLWERTGRIYDVACLDSRTSGTQVYVIEFSIAPSQLLCFLLKSGDKNINSFLCSLCISSWGDPSRIPPGQIYHNHTAVPIGTVGHSVAGIFFLPLCPWFLVMPPQRMKR